MSIGNISSSTTLPSSQSQPTTALQPNASPMGLTIAQDYHRKRVAGDLGADILALQVGDQQSVQLMGTDLQNQLGGAGLAQPYANRISADAQSPSPDLNNLKADAAFMAALNAPNSVMGPTTLTGVNTQTLNSVNTPAASDGTNASTTAASGNGADSTAASPFSSSPFSTSSLPGNAPNSSQAMP